GELNPIKDVSDSTNIRSGNPGLRPTLTDNFDLVLGKTKKSFFINVGFGYNNIADIFSAIRITPTEITWQNISAKKEYEVSTWSGYTISKRTKLNWSASYTHNRYATYDKVVRRFRDGGSLSSSLNTNYTWKDIYNATGSFTYNRFANPQGTVRSNLSMNLGLQAKVLAKKMTLTMNLIDPLRGQQNKTVTYGSNFIFESFSASQTRNLRLTVGYNFPNAGLKKGSKVPVENKKKQNQLSKKK
ncbi:MAG TPA: outer membrane beta-barrel protein, partial [Flavisolibacter sp.]|nr:outer membrane beta-barrel protein [Flavisolibacter sp.]